MFAQSIEVITDAVGVRVRLTGTVTDSKRIEVQA